MKTAPVISVSHLNWISKGYQRLVFIHPNDEKKILKVSYSGEVTDKLLRNAPIADRSKNRHVSREHYIYKKNTRLLAMHPFDAPIPHFFGTIETDIGNADVYEGLFRQDRSKLGLTLEQVILRDLMGHKTLADLNSFVARLDRWNIPVTDLNAKNIVYGFRGNKRVFVLVDGFGDYRRLPLASWSRRIRLQRTSVAYSEIANRLGFVWESNARTFRF